MARKHFARKIYHSEAWLQVRQRALERDHYLCQDCLKDGMYTPAEEVHHIVWLTPENMNDPSISLNLENLVSLCHNCHTRRHSEQHTKRYTVDEMGRVTII